jgi:hypothetical protein
MAYSATAGLIKRLNESETQEPPSSPPDLVVPESDLDLGRVYETHALKHNFRLTNPGNRVVTITKFNTSCECLGITPGTKVVLQPHETKTFTMKLALVWRPNKAGSPAEPFRVSFGAVYSVEGEGPLTTFWRLTCVIVPTLKFKPPVLQLGAQSKRQSAIEQTMAIEATEEVRRIEVEPSSRWGVDIVRVQGTSPNQFRAVVRSRGELRLGEVSDVVRLTPIGRDKKPLPAKELKIVGEIVQDVVASPRDVHHGRQSCGTSAAEVIQLRSLTDRLFRVKKVSVRGGDLAVTPLPGSGSYYSLRLRFSKPGDQEAVAEFMIRDEDGAEYSIAVPVRYHGLPSP